MISLLPFLPVVILGDPGSVCGTGEKSKRARKKFGQRKVNFFLARLDFSPAPLTAPGSPRMPCCGPNTDM